MQLPKNIDYQRWNDFDHTHEAIRGRSWKNVIFDAIAQNHKTTEHVFFFAIRIVLIFKTVFKIMIFQKIVDGDPTKITKMSRKIDTREAIVEKH